MDFDLDADQQAWLAEVREFLRANVTDALRAEIAEHNLEHPGGEVAAFRRKLGAKGWFGLNWPAEYGGLGLGAVHLHLLMSEFEYWGVPGPDLTVTSIAPMIMRHGTEQNKKEFLPLIARGEMTCALGYSEPDAGTDTTRNQVAASVQVLCEHPDQWALLGTHPDLADRAVEETMRHSPIVISSLRMAREDVELAGMLIPAGTFLQVNTGAANRDPAVYDDPDRLDITRAGAPAMQTFGAGMHYCLGVHLAKMELAEALALMTQRMPNARVTGPVPWKPLVGLSGPITLPIAFDPVDGSLRAAS